MVWRTYDNISNTITVGILLTCSIGFGDGAMIAKVVLKTFINTIFSGGWQCKSYTQIK